MWWQWGIGLCMLAFLVLSGFAIHLLRRVSLMLMHTDQTVAELSRQARQSVLESERLLRTSNAVMQDLQSKLQAADVWFEAAVESGEAVHRLSRSVQAATRTVEHTVQAAERTLHDGRDTISDMVELASAGLHLWRRWQASRSTQTKE